MLIRHLLEDSGAETFADGLDVVVVVGLDRVVEAFLGVRGFAVFLRELVQAGFLIEVAGLVQVGIRLEESNPQRPMLAMM